MDNVITPNGTFLPCYKLLFSVNEFVFVRESTEYCLLEWYQVPLGHFVNFTHLFQQ